MNVSFLPAASKELKSAISHHEASRPGYGSVFASEFQHAVERMKADPDSFTKVEGEYRSISLRKFPYSVVFRRVSEVDVIIVAVAHAKRRPGYWRQRLSR